jgi:hypothetical protein
MARADRSKPRRIRHGPAQLTGHRIGTGSFFLDVLDTYRGRTLAAGADRGFSGRGRRSAAVVRRGVGGGPAWWLRCSGCMHALRARMQRVPTRGRGRARPRQLPGSVMMATATSCCELNGGNGE